jgi:serine/threonine-protein kinase RsbT
MDDETITSPIARKVIAHEMDVVEVRQLVKKHAVKLKFGLTEQTKLVTAASEIARNTLKYGLGGDLKLYHIKTDFTEGLKLVFQDEGPGIADIAQALQNGFTSGKGIGLGLGGSKRLVSEFNIISKIGQGTIVTLIKWRA